MAASSDASALVSVVVAAYNAQGTMRRSLDSVLDQGDPNVEVIVVDDGSSDATADIARDYAQSHQNVRLVRQHNAGPSAARNAGMDAACGEWLIMLDADDTQAPHALKTLRGEMSAHVDAILFPVEKLLASGGVLREQGYVETTNAHGMARCILEPNGPYQGYMTNKCVRTSVARATGHLNTSLRYCEDEEWWIRVAAVLDGLHGDESCVRIIDTYLYVYDQRQDGLRVGSLLDASASARDAIVGLVDERWPDLAPLAKARHALWQNRAVVAVLRSRKRGDAAKLRGIMCREYRAELYRSSHLGLPMKAKSAVLGGLGALLVAWGRGGARER